MNFIPCSVYRPNYDCTNGGVTSKYDRFAMVIPEDHGLPGPMPSLPVLNLVKRNLFGKEYVHAVPEGKDLGYMFGGNFVYSSDSRFPSPYPIPVHDRAE